MPELSRGAYCNADQYADRAYGHKHARGTDGDQYRGSADEHIHQHTVADHNEHTDTCADGDNVNQPVAFSFDSGAGDRIGRAEYQHNGAHYQ
jgi:hypothetical protein